MPIKSPYLKRKMKNKKIGEKLSQTDLKIPCENPNLPSRWFNVDDLGAALMVRK